MHLKHNRLSRIVVLACCLSGSLIIGGCANLAGTGTGVTASDPTKMTRSGFLSDYEKFFMLTAFAQYGISLLKKEQADIEDSQSSEIDNPLKYFIEKCCEQKEVSDTDKVHEHNSTAIRTLQCAYNNFFCTPG